MYQSVLAKRQATGSSGTGFFFAVVKVKEVHPDRDLCLVEDMNTSDQQDLPISKRGETAWPQVGDVWVMDRSMGHWMLQCRVTAASPPVFTGNSSTMDADTLRLASLLKGLGLIKDGTAPGTIPAVTGSKAQIRPEVQQILSILDARGVLDDQTTAATVEPEVWHEATLASGWTAYTATTTPRYKLNYDNTVSIEGRATPPATVTSGDTMFTLPVGYRPPNQKYFTSMIGNGVVGNIAVGSDGTVKIWDFGSNTVVRVLFHIRYSLLA